MWFCWSQSVVNMIRCDWGAFRCSMFSPVSHSTSDPELLSIIYELQTTLLSRCIILQIPEWKMYCKKHLIKRLFKVNLIPWLSIGDFCFLYYLFWHFHSKSTLQRGQPSSLWVSSFYKVYLVSLPDIGPQLKLVDIQMSLSGNYSCQAFNNRTVRYETSEPAAVNIMSRLTWLVTYSIKPNITWIWWKGMCKHGTIGVDDFDLKRIKCKKKNKKKTMQRISQSIYSFKTLIVLFVLPYQRKIFSCVVWC